MKLSFLGAGNMATAIIGGILKQNLCEKTEIMATRRTPEALARLEQDYGILTTGDNIQAARWADILFLAVKPQMLPGVMEEIAPVLRPEQLVVSIAAGKTLAWLEEGLGRETKLIRCMPNTPALVGEGCTGICANEKVSREELETVTRIFNSCGISYVVEESLMDAVGALSGSSPAFVFMFMEALADGAVAEGMPRQLAYDMAAQTVLGSARLMQETKKHPGELKDMVCSPAGTTICGVKALQEGGMHAALMDAIDKCVQRSKQI
jgi:pyrroline-5-carboxylate reductase